MCGVHIHVAYRGTYAMCYVMCVCVCAVTCACAMHACVHCVSVALNVNVVIILNCSGEIKVKGSPPSAV